MQIMTQGGQVVEPAVVVTSRKVSAGHSLKRAKERCSQTSALDVMKEERVDSPEIAQTKEALGRLKKLKYSDVYSALVELYTSMTSIRTDIPEASETPETWEPEEYHQELRSNLKEMHRLIAEKTTAQTLRKAVRTVATQSEVEMYDPKVKILEGQLRERNIEVNRFTNELNLMKLEKKQDAELLARTREHVRELEEKLTRFEIELRSLRRKEGHISSNLHDLKQLSQLSEEKLRELFQGHFRLKALLYKADSRARKAEKAALGNEKAVEELKIMREAAEKRLLFRSDKQDKPSSEGQIALENDTQIEAETIDRLKELEQIYAEKAAELEARQNQEFEEMNQEITRLETLLAEFQGLRDAVATDKGHAYETSDQKSLAHKAGDQSIPTKEAAAGLRKQQLLRNGTVAEGDEGGESEGELGGKGRRNRRKGGKNRTNGSPGESDESGTPGSRMTGRRGGGEHYGGDEDTLAAGGRDKRGEDGRFREAGKGYGEETGEGGRSRRDGQTYGPGGTGRRLESIEGRDGTRPRGGARGGNVDLSQLDQSDLDLLHVIFGTSELHSVPQDDLEHVVSDLSSFKSLPPSEREIFLRVRDSIRKHLRHPPKVSLSPIDSKDEDLLRAMFGVQDLAVIDPEYMREAVGDLEYFRSLPEPQKAVYIRVRDIMRRHIARNRNLGKNGLADERGNERGVGGTSIMESGAGGGRKGGRDGDAMGLNSVQSTELERNPELIFDFAPGHNFYIPGMSKEELMKYEMQLKRIMQGHDHQRCGQECEHLRRAYLFKKKMHGKVFPMKVVHLTYHHS